MKTFAFAALMGSTTASESPLRGLQTTGTPFDDYPGARSSVAASELSGEFGHNADARSAFNFNWGTLLQQQQQQQPAENTVPVWKRTRQNALNAIDWGQQQRKNDDNNNVAPAIIPNHNDANNGVTDTTTNKNTLGSGVPAVGGRSGGGLANAGTSHWDWNTNWSTQASQLISANNRPTQSIIGNRPAQRSERFARQDRNAGAGRGDWIRHPQPDAGRPGRASGGGSSQEGGGDELHRLGQTTVSAGRDNRPELAARSYDAKFDPWTGWQQRKLQTESASPMDGFGKRTLRGA
jgi:hypothetical protein